ncbi:endo-1,3-1,4-beta glucanase-related protein [Bacteroidales bacterium]|nr:endo-1,3-1,4-beta glucanase-related protein [Bacteroidales bacterium]
MNINKTSLLFIFLAIGGLNFSLAAQDDSPKEEAMKPQMSEFWTPKASVVTPGNSSSNASMSPPSDAIVLFDGKNLKQWTNQKGEPAKWDLKKGSMIVNKKHGDIQSKQEFGDFQLHIEWCVPANIRGEGQSRGNSGIFLQNRYEIQILDSYNNQTYVNGQAASIYKQAAPLANAMRKPGEWNVYDIIYAAPTFTKDGKYRTPPTVTILHNGVLVQNNTSILGTTQYIGFPQINPHGKAPIRLQSHGDPSEPIAFRNVWIREL